MVWWEFHGNFSEFHGISRNFMGSLGISWDFNGIERGFSEIEWDTHQGMTYFRNPKKAEPAGEIPKDDLDRFVIHES